MNRFELEDAMSDLYQIGQDIETIIYAIGDSPIKHTEDELLNMLIGMKQMHNTRYQKMWNVFDQLIKNGTIANKNIGDDFDEDEFHRDLEQQLDKKHKEAIANKDK
jgi:hypothetical protein